jgi:hypothetical protein
MKKLITLAALLTAVHTSFAQPAKPSYAYYEGFNLSMGIGQNSTQATTNSGTTKGNTSLGISKINYTFALAYPAKLGVSATFDMKNSKIGDQEYLAVSAPTEVSIEPGVLLLSNSLLYGKVGTYTSTYQAGGNPNRNLSGMSYGVGFKHYVYGQNFIQAEWTQRNADDNRSGLDGIKFKQSSAAIYVGFNF